MLLLCLMGLGAMQRVVAADKEIYAVLDKPSHTFTLYYDENRESRCGSNNGSANYWTWQEGTEHMLKSDLGWVYTVIIDESMQHTAVGSCRQWFANMTCVTAFEHLDYLISVLITDTYRMFYKCERVPFLDLHSFLTGNVTNMEEMFAECTNLAVLDISSSTARNWKDVKEVRTTRMFADCTNLQVIFCKDDDPMFSRPDTEEAESWGMFLNCKKLVGGNGTVYDKSQTDGSYAHSDNPGNPGYFTSVLKSKDPRLYGKLEEDGTTLTLRYDQLLGPNRGMADWSVYNNDGIHNRNYDCWAVKKIVFDESMQDTLPKSTLKWFYYFMSLTEIEHLDYLKTSHVTDMSWMFSECSSLQTLDLSSFDTKNVKDMSDMFNGCESLKSLDISSFNTANVKNMSGMFYDCRKLSELDLRHFNTENVTRMDRMFYQAISLKKLDISTFNTSNVTSMTQMFKSCPFPEIDVSSFDTRNVVDMSAMFVHCKNLTSLNLTSFKFDKVEDVNHMFYGSANLEAIYCNEDMSKAPELKQYEGLFGLCEKLTGGAGTAFTAEHESDLSYARPDALDEPGYFTSTAESDKPEIYAKLSKDGTTLTIRYDKKRPVVGGASNWLRYNNADDNEKAETNRVVKVVIDETMKDAKPTSTKKWFKDFRYLKTITGLDLLNTSEVTSMREMFAHCDSLRDMSVSTFDTQNVSDFSYMFAGCGRLRKVDVSHFNTSNATNMSHMFEGCKRLVAIKVDNFDTRNVTNMSHMFDSCVWASPINVSGFNTENVTDFSYMFAGCAYETGLAVSGFRSEKVTNLAGMFYGCKNLHSLDLSGISISQVTDVSNMFCYDSSLVVIRANADWGKSPALTVSDNMFYGCPKLKGGAGTVYDEAHVDATYARPDGGTGDEGYFTSISEIYAVWDNPSQSLTLYYDSKREERGGVTEWWQTLYLYYLMVEKVVLDASMKKAEPESTANWFRNFWLLETIEHLDYLRTYNVRDMSYMFSNCSKLTAINVNGFSLAWVETAEGMFSECSALTTIWCDHNWHDYLYGKNSDNMFTGCTSLVGGKGTAYDPNYTNSSRACTDSNLRYGYFTAMPTGDGGSDLSGNELYAVLESDNTTLTIHYDKNRASLGGSTSWSKYSSTYSYHITEVVFDQTVENAQPTNTEDWFRDFSELTTITGIEYLNTEYVTSMSGMFKNCSALETLDVSNFNTQNVTDMGFMFSDCKALKELDLSHFDMRKVTIMYNMFENCEALTTLDIKEFDTGEVKDMAMLFAGCKNLTELDLTKLNTSNVEDMMGMFAQCEQLTELDVSNFQMDNIKSLIGMFYGCTSLTTIWCNDDWGKLPLLEYHNDMFTGCTSLIGGGNTVYDEANANDATFAHVGTAGSPGYFTTNLTYHVTLTAENGKIEVEEEVDLDAVPWGTVLHLNAVPFEGFVLDSWTNYNGSALTVNEDVEVTANFSVQTFTVTFIDWDEHVIDQQVVEWGKAAIAPEDPTREESIFIGWNPADFSAVYEDMNIYAEYVPAVFNYSVTFVAENGKIIADQDVNLSEVPKGTILYLTAEPDYGYVFDHWENYDPELGLYVNEDITVTAYFTPQTFTVTFLDKDGNPIGEPQTVDIGQAAVAPTAPEVEGFTFTGWDKAFDNVTEDLTVQALYEALELYTLTVVVEPAEGGTYMVTGLDENQQGAFFAEFTIDATPNEGYEFVGWKDGDMMLDEKELTINRVLYGDMTITILFKKKTGTGVDQLPMTNDQLPIKFLLDGVLYIERDGKTYDVTGRLVE